MRRFLIALLAALVGAAATAALAVAHNDGRGSFARPLRLSARTAQR